MPLKIDAYALTDVGLQRENNEDAFDMVPEREFFVVCDGMGGHASGQVASRVAIDAIRRYMLELSRDKGQDHAFPTPEAFGPGERLLSSAIQYANERVFIESMKDRRYDGMGTTLVAVLGWEGAILLGHVGDSRIYRFRDGQIEQVTRDHSLLNHYIDQGKITTEADKKAFKEKNIIVKALGLKDYVDPEVTRHDKREGDLYLLCSDGLSDQVEDWIIGNVIDNNAEDLPIACSTLIRLSNEAGGKDNCTVMILKIEESTSVAIQAAPSPRKTDTEPSLPVITDTIPEMPAFTGEERTDPNAPVAGGFDDSAFGFEDKIEDKSD